jgi:hypothetical protein
MSLCAFQLQIHPEPSFHPESLWGPGVVLAFTLAAAESIPIVVRKPPESQGH